MNQENIKNSQRIEKYVLGQLNEDDAAEFELFIMENPSIIDEVKTVEKMVQGLHHLRDTNTLPRGNQQTMPIAMSIGERIREFLSSSVRYPVPAWGMAAILLLIMAPMGVLLKQTTLSQPNQSGVVMMTIDSASAERGDLVEQVYTIEQTDKRIVLALLLQTNTHPTYRFSLLDANNKELWHNDNLHADFSDTLHIDMGIGFLKKGLYAYSITGVGEKGETTEVEKGIFRIQS